ncbi:hypothetical protein HDU79_009324 [Rhizoclosmatium sp. JEL0117]|nr:hypothetical protein HDU79_009324 [Rhizoclosmatium sp. JEL0117]
MSSSAQYISRGRELGSTAASGLMQWYGKLPAGVAVVVALCTALQVLNTFFTVPGCLSGASWLSRPFTQVYTFIMNHFLHTGWIHLIFNMLAFVPFAGYQERNMGTYPMLHLVLLLGVATSAIYVVLTFLFGFLFKGLWVGCVAGISGVVFALISLEANKGDLQTQDFFGLKIPGSMFPWFLIIVTQFIFMGSSFFGHLSGIFAGILYAQGILDKAFPSPSYFHRLESTPFFAFIHGLPNFIPQPGGISLPSYNATPLSTVSPTTTYYQRSSYQGYGAVGGNAPGQNSSQDQTALMSDRDI